MKRKMSILFLILVFTLTSLGPTTEAASPVTYKNNPGNLKTVTIDPDSVKFDLVTANNRIIGSESMTSMINRKKPLAAINGNFFDAYKSLVPYGSFIKDRRIIYLEGNNASFYIDKKGKPAINTFSMTMKANVFNKGEHDNSFNIWYVNTNPNDRTGIYLFTPERGNSISLQGGSALTVRNNKITSISHNAKKTTIPKDGYIIYFGQDAMTKEEVNSRFKKGFTLELKQNLPEKVTKNDPDFQIETMVSAGPMLVENGKNVSKKYGASFESKIANSRAQRSAIGITKNNKVIIVTKSNVTINELSNNLINLGCVSGMNLDGGASSSLYANGRYISKAGRKLNNMLIVTSKPKQEVKSNVILSINDKKIDIPREYGSPYINADSRTMVPVRFISETLGYDVEWQESNQTVTIDNRIKIQIGSKKAYLDGKLIELDTQAIKKNSRTYVPIAFVSEALGYSVSYKRDAKDPYNINHFINISE